MAKVKNLKISLQSGSTNLHYATWAFDSGASASGSGSIKVGVYVQIKSGSKYYNGVSIPTWVMNDTWKVIEVSGNRAVLGPNKSNTNNIQSPVHVNNLTVVSTAKSTATTYADSEKYLDHYNVKWYYDTGNSVWFTGSSEDTTRQNSTYSAPENASRIKVTVKPVSKTHKVNNKDVSYWTGTGVSATFSTASNPPEVPPTPEVELDDKYYLTAKIDNISDPRSDQVQFQVYDKQTLYKTGTVNVSACMASYKCGILAGGNYRVRARSINIVSTKKVYSDWSDFSTIQGTIPAGIKGFEEIRATSSTSVYMEWYPADGADTYEIEYATKISYFDKTSETTTVSGIKYAYYEVTGLETGDEYFFRVRGVNDQGESPWSSISSVVIGKDPAAPTTWSSSTTVITGQPLNLYWVHNAKDGSTETYAEVEIRIGEDIQVYTIKNEYADDDENEDKDKTKHYAVDTSQYIEGTQIKWRVRTAGVTKSYGDWSVQRTVDIYAPPTLELSLKNQNGVGIELVEAFPVYINGFAGPNTQMPIGYYVIITADEGYETVDNVGRVQMVNPGDEVYSAFIDSNNPLLIELSANNINLENNISYTITVVVSMNSGLNTTESIQFEVSWEDDQYDIDAEIGIDEDTYVAYITPYCYPLSSDENLPDEDEPYEPQPVTDVLLAVYRREFDGTFTEIATGLESENNTVVTDPHPALDYARYRIVATSKLTGAISYYDPPGYPIQCKSIIIQWDEEWSYFDATEDDEELAQPPWTGSMLNLPYNIDVSDDNSPEVSLVNYIGRTYPVSYYGTSIDSSATWNVDIPYYDVDTLYALRRLAIWKGDAYVREPSGSGYWANVNVSFSQKHKELVIPVTFRINRVDGGM